MAYDAKWRRAKAEALKVLGCAINAELIPSRGPLVRNLPALKALCEEVLQDQYPMLYLRVSERENLDSTRTTMVWIAKKKHWRRRARKFGGRHG